MLTFTAVIYSIRVKMTTCVIITIGLAILMTVSAEYYKVVYEACPELSSKTSFFDNLLLPCKIS